MAQAARKMRANEVGFEPSRRFTVLQGAGLDLARRAGISPAFYNAVRIVVVTCILLAIIAIARVGMTTLTVSTLMTNSQMKAEIAQAVSYGNDLQVQEAIFSNPTRIRSIATGVMGMTEPAQVAQLDMGGSAASNVPDAIVAAGNGVAE